ncbi:MAG: hypothetical protein HY921_05015 [Elusimicrobia bacterium]|nr:hypothetical protein [Elusimicrobiota bacterium]
MRKYQLGLALVAALSASAYADFAPSASVKVMRSEAANAGSVAAKEIAAMYVLPYNVEFNISSGHVNAVIDVPRNYYRFIEDVGGFVEVRLYAGDQRGQERRIMKHKEYQLRGHRASFTFPQNSVCDSDSFFSYNRHLKVWASARNANGSPMSLFESPNDGRRFTVTCRGLIWDIINGD